MTEFIFAEEQFTFYVDAIKAARQVRHVEECLAREMCRTDTPADKVVGNLVALGEELSDILLQHDTRESAREERRDLAVALAAAKGAIIYQLGVPVPIELLSFTTPIGGIGRFARMLGGRREAWSQNGRRAGRVVGSGAILFHDDLVGSCEHKTIHSVLDVAFPNGVDFHHALIVTQKAAAQAEIDRLFRNSSASWAHFQCHAFEKGDVRLLRLTNDFTAAQNSFKEPGISIAAIMMNACSGTRMSESWHPARILESSWAEYFTGECQVPAVIGPFCEVLDDRTMPFTELFYDKLASQPRVLRAFCEARAASLANDDFTAFSYRYIGPSGLTVPEQARVPSRPAKLGKVA